MIVSVHSFNPTYKNVRRPWHIGIIHDDDRRLAAPLIDALSAMSVVVGVNEPYSPADRVYYTLERHARARGMPCAMIEIRNDEIEGEDTQRKWAEMLAEVLSHIKIASPQRPAVTWKHQAELDVSKRVGTQT